jgi:FkbM family methyltransferase
MSLKSAGVGLIQRTIARSILGVKAVIKVRNQCDAIIGARVSPGINMGANGEEWLLQLVAPHVRYFVDVGANVGAWSLRASELMIEQPRGLLIEPSPATAAKLIANVVNAGLSGLEVIQCAASDRLGEAPFFAEDDEGETSSLLANHSGAGAKRHPIRLTTLDVELAARNVENVDLLKIDAEGYDLQVMLGCEALLSKGGIGVLQFEYNAPWRWSGATLWRAFQFLQSFDYTVCLLRPDSLSTFPIDRVGEYYRYSNFVAFKNGRLGSMLRDHLGRSAI